MKCDSQKPCKNCIQKSFLCDYTREGYSDPYSPYRIDQPENGHEHGSSTPKSDNNNAIQNAASDHSTAPGDDDDNSESFPIFSSEDQANSDGHGNHAADFLPADTTMQMDLPDVDHHEFSDNLDFLPVSESPADANFESWLDFPFEWNLQISDPNELELSLLLANTSSNDVISPNWSSLVPDLLLDNTIPTEIPIAPPEPPGFLLHQIDPVAAKCSEMRELLQDGLVDDTVLGYITRQNLVTTSELLAKSFLPNVPILHMPSFNISDTSPILLLAIMLVGACYSDNIIPLSETYQLAMRLLVLIETLPVGSYQ